MLTEGLRHQSRIPRGHGGEIRRHDRALRWVPDTKRPSGRHGKGSLEDETQPGDKYRKRGTT
jgi:hypothetical protein